MQVQLQADQQLKMLGSVKCSKVRNMDPHINILPYWLCSTLSDIVILELHLKQYTVHQALVLHILSSWPLEMQKRKLKVFQFITIYLLLDTLHAAVLQDRLHEKQKRLGEPLRLILVRESLGAALLDINIDIFTQNEWNLCKPFVVLKPLADATKEVSRENFPTSGEDID
ncbi:hypothetical protein PR048_018135 [Dryococelus australis]|uniref:Uncharacterized protein n=1 Tax=Dryococelus australis TaxID=614101 RepID=A0ABQ9HBK0_9NEOP|nr:hypothetical protein PR048_018135 [Dryococelus australis]